MKEFFQNLKEKREEKGITLEEIHSKTYLPLHYLTKIESGELDGLPSGYDRIYLRRYASEIGLDVDEVLRDYDLMSGKLKPSGPEPEKTHQVEKSASISTTIPANKPSTPKHMPLKSNSMLQQLNLDKLHKYFWIFLAVSIIVVTGFITYRQYINHKNDQITIKEIPSTYVSRKMVALSSLESVEEPTAPIEGHGSADTPPESNKSFVVELRAIDTTWIRQIQDVQDTTEYILPPGLNRKVEAIEQLKFMVGKASGIEFWLNGDSLGVMGKANEVVTSLIISEKGIVEKKLKKVVKKSAAKVDSSIAVIPIL